MHFIRGHSRNNLFHGISPFNKPQPINQMKKIILALTTLDVAYYTFVVGNILFLFTDCFYLYLIYTWWTLKLSSPVLGKTIPRYGIQDVGIFRLLVLYRYRVCHINDTIFKKMYFSRQIYLFLITIQDS